MRLTQLTLRQFRNIKELEFKPHPILNIFVGDNGQGKTSLIEGIYFLSTLKSFRNAKTGDLIQQNKAECQLSTTVLQKEGDIETALKVRLEDGKKLLVLDGKSTTAGKFVSQIRAVVFSPESLGSIKSGPEARRELVDQGVFQSSHTGALAQQQFSRALRQRNACLRQMRDGQVSMAKGRDILESLDRGYGDVASQVIFERLHFLDALFLGTQEILTEITGEKDTFSFSYQSDDREWKERDQKAIAERFLRELQNITRRTTEESLGVTLTGPHRHDLSFLFNGNDSRIFCSQGQQRALILAFKIAEIVYHRRTFGTYPLLLLDDVLSEFDERKRRFLIDFLRKNEAQTFLTTTDLVPGLGPAPGMDGCSIFRIDAGNLIHGSEHRTETR